MIDIKSISSGLTLGDDDIWYSQDTQNTSYPSDGNEKCFSIEDGSFWFHHRNGCITSVVKTYPPKNNGTIFDIGGGNGFVSAHLISSGFDVVLLEPGKAGAINAKSRGLKNIICATTKTAQLNPNSISGVGLFDVIEHIEDDLEFLRSIQKIMKPDGRIYATVPAYSFLWSEEDVEAGHFKRYKLKDLSKVFKSAGFEVEFSSYIFRFLPFPIFLLRTIPYNLGLSRAKETGENDTGDHAKKAGFITKILNVFLKKEIKNLDNKKLMRFGGSCLIVAKSPKKE